MFVVHLDGLLFFLLGSLAAVILLGILKNTALFFADKILLQVASEMLREQSVKAVSSQQIRQEQRYALIPMEQIDDNSHERDLDNDN